MSERKWFSSDFTNISREMFDEEINEWFRCGSDEAYFKKNGIKSEGAYCVYASGKYVDIAAILAVIAKKYFSHLPTEIQEDAFRHGAWRVLRRWNKHLITRKEIERISQLPESRTLGTHLGAPITIVHSNSGPIIEWGFENLLPPTSEKVIRKSLPKFADPALVELPECVHYLQFPRELGVHPEKKSKIVVSLGDAPGEYKISWNFRRDVKVPPSIDPLSVTLEQAVDLVNQSVEQDPPRIVDVSRLEDLGTDPNTGNIIYVARQTKMNGDTWDFATDGTSWCRLHTSPRNGSIRLDLDAIVENFQQQRERSREAAERKATSDKQWNLRISRLQDQKYILEEQIKLARVGEQLAMEVKELEALYVEKRNEWRIGNIELAKKVRDASNFKALHKLAGGFEKTEKEQLRLLESIDYVVGMLKQSEPTQDFEMLDAAQFELSFLKKQVEDNVSRQALENNWLNMVIDIASQRKSIEILESNWINAFKSYVASMERLYKFKTEPYSYIGEATE
jgi:topoisomerase IA-like protein